MRYTRTRDGIHDSAFIQEKPPWAKQPQDVMQTHGTPIPTCHTHNTTSTHGPKLCRLSPPLQVPTRAVHSGDVTVTGPCMAMPPPLGLAQPAVSLKAADRESRAKPQPETTGRARLITILRISDAGRRGTVLCAQHVRGVSFSLGYDRDDISFSRTAALVPETVAWSEGAEDARRHYVALPPQAMPPPGTVQPTPCDVIVCRM